MKVLLFLPAAYLSGVHGFALFAPYLMLMLASIFLLRHYGKVRAERAARAVEQARI